MRSIPLAITWEMLSRGRWGLITFLLGANLFPILIFSALRWEGVEMDDPSMIKIQASLIQLNMFLFGAAVLAAQGSPARLYTYPIPTSTLVAWHMIPAGVLAGLETLVSTMAINAIFDIKWPIWGPVIFVAVTLVACQATFWYCEKSVWLVVGVTLVAGSLGYWYIRRFTPTLLRPPANIRQWPDVTAIEVVLLAIVALIAYFVGIAALNRNRCGEQMKSLGILAWLDRVLDSKPVFSPRFRSATEAQLWFEWKKKGWALPVTAAFGLFMGLSVWLFFVRSPKDLINGLIAGGALLSVAGMICGLIMGSVGTSDSSFDIGHFLASRPLTNSDLARVILKITAKSVLSAWSIWAGTFLVVSGILLVTGFAPQPFFPNEIPWWYLPATLLGCWTVVSVIASVLLSARLKPVAQILSTLFVLYLGLLCFANFVLSRDAQAQLSLGAVTVCGIVFVIVSVCVFFAAWRQGLITSSTVGICASIWLVLSTIVMLEWVQRPIAPFPMHLFFVGIAALTVVPIGAAPLALSWNRNR